MQLETLTMDVRYALRGIGRAPLFDQHGCDHRPWPGRALFRIDHPECLDLRTINSPIQRRYRTELGHGPVQSHGFGLADFDAASENRTSPFVLAAVQSNW